MGKNPAGGGTPLARRTDRAKHNGPQCQIQIRAGRNDQRIVAAQFQQTPPQPPRHGFGHLPAHRRGTRRGNQRQPPVGRHAFPDGFVPAYQAENRGVHLVRVADFFRNSGGGNRRQRGQFGRFPDGGVAAHGGQRRIPAPDRHGKIKRGDHAGDTQRMPLLQHAVLRPFGGNGQPKKLARQTRCKIADINHLLHFPFALRQDFAIFQRD